MEVNLKKETIQQYSCVYTDATHREETVEYVVPDTMPDIDKILSTDCVLYLRGKTVQDGKVTAEGNLQASVLYLPDHSCNVQRLEVAKSVIFSWENDVLQEDDQIFICLRVNSADVRSLNPRKILLRADLCSELNAYRREDMLLPVENEEEDLQILPAECSFLSIAHVGEKSFSVSEEFTMSSSHSGLDEILTARAWATVDELKSVGEKMILQGTVFLRVLYIPKEDTQPKVECFTTGFSQIMDCAENAAGPHTVILMPTALHLDSVSGGSGSPMILMDLHVTAQLICRKKSTLHYISDAYSLSGEESLEILPMKICSDGEVVILRETVRELLDTPGPVAEILDGFVQPGVPMTGENGIRLPLNVNILYRSDEGIVGSICRRLQADIACEAVQAHSLYIHPARCTDSYFSATAGGIEVRLPVELKVERYEEKNLFAVNSVSVDETINNPESTVPSITLVRCRDTDLWSLAKQYRTTREKIESANKNSVEIGQLLLIPRAR